MAATYPKNSKIHHAKLTLRAEPTLTAKDQ